MSRKKRENVEYWITTEIVELVLNKRLKIVVTHVDKVYQENSKKESIKLHIWINIISILTKTILKGNIIHLDYNKE